jgi:hypothetical protein
MKKITQDIKDGLDFALNEASVLGLDFDEKNRTVYITFYPIAIQADGKIPIDNRFLFAFRNVARLASSLILDNDTIAIKFEPSQLADKISEYKNEQLYGWEFFDNGDKIFKDWQDNKSFDLIINNNFIAQHTIDIFQEDKFSKKTIDVRIWFDNIDIFDSNLKPYDIQTFIDNGKRGWAKLDQSGWTTTDKELGDKLRLKE